MWKHHSYNEKKLMFYELDQRVMNIPDEDISTIPDFIEKLTSWIPKDNTNKEIYLVRGFTIWLRHVTGRKLAGEQPTVPNEILDFFEDNYTFNMIEIFCRNAGIEAEIVEGITKGITYRAGDIVDDSNLLMKYKGVWLAFRCNKQWHLVDVFDVLSGHQEGDEILLEEGGQRLVKRREAAIGTRGTSESELWFCPDPVLASYDKLPDDEKWQLLPHDQKVKSVNEFFDLPHCHDFFFECQVRLISERTCRLTSKNGKNVIRLMVGGPKSVTTRFTYSLSLIGDCSYLPDLSALPLLVCQTRDQDVVTFEIRYPMVGIYYLVIHVKKPGMSSFLHAISFHLTCTEVDIKLKTLPINTGPSGFGYNDSAEDTGLTRPSTSKAKLVVKPSNDGQERQKITFDLDEDIVNHIEYASTIYTSVMADDGTYTKTESQGGKNEVDGKLVIDVGLKTGGEHCLAIASRKKDTKDPFLLFMYYLVTSQEDSEDEEVLAEVERQKRSLRSAEKLSKKKKIKSEYEIQLETLASEIEELKEQYEGINTKDFDVKTDLVERDAQTDTVQNIDAGTDTGGCVHTVDISGRIKEDTRSQAEIVYKKVLQVLESAYPNVLTVQGLSRIVEADEVVILEQLQELQTRSLVQQLENGEFVRHVLDEKTEVQVVKQMATVTANQQPTIAVITAKYCEKLAVDAMMEDKTTYVKLKTGGESNAYTIGYIGKHKVVSTKLPMIGHGRAAQISSGNTTTRLLGTFQAIEHVFVVGVGGGVPHFADYFKHPRLGDVVISDTRKTGSMYFHCNKVYQERDGSIVFESKSFCPKDTVLQDIADNIVQKIQDPNFTLWQKYINKGLELLSKQEADFNRPPSDTDRLTMMIGEGNVIEMQHPLPPDGVDSREGIPKIRQGIMGSGKRFAKADDLRLDFASRYGVNVFDSEFDQVLESIEGNAKDSYMFIRGISDYTDGSQELDWQPYSALAAATVMKLIIKSFNNPHLSEDELD